MGTPVFLPFLQRGITFVTSCLLDWTMEAFQKGSTLKGKFAPIGVNYFLYELNPTDKGGSNEIIFIAASLISRDQLLKEIILNGGVVSLESVPI